MAAFPQVNAGRKTAEGARIRANAFRPGEMGLKCDIPIVIDSGVSGITGIVKGGFTENESAVVSALGQRITGCQDLRHLTLLKEKRALAQGIRPKDRVQTMRSLRHEKQVCGLSNR